MTTSCARRLPVQRVGASRSQPEAPFCCVRESGRDGTRPPGATTALLLAHADGQHQARAVGDQFAGRVGLFLRVDDFEAAYGRMRSVGVEFVTEPRQEPYGQVVVFVDVAGNRWDLLGPRPDR